VTDLEGKEDGNGFRRAVMMFKAELVSGGKYWMIGRSAVLDNLV
jgi:hypothetical protein